MNRVGKFFALGGADRALVLRAAVALGFVRLAIVVIGFKRLRDRIEGTRLSRTRVERSAAPDRIAWAVQAAGTAIPGGRNCLMRALATELLMRRAGYPCELRIGVSNSEPAGFKAHAWLESEGKILIGEFALGEYAALNRPEASAR